MTSCGRRSACLSERLTVVDYSDIASAFEGTGLVARGGFHLGPDDGVKAASLILIGNTGAEMWIEFARAEQTGRDPLDTWTKNLVAPRANLLGAAVHYPNDKPYRPFQQWAARAEPIAPSPLGLLIHPDFGLWHAYRAALIFDNPVGNIPARGTAPVPCETCRDKPCLSTCPVDAFAQGAYDVPTCVAYLKADPQAACHTEGCLARNACPVGTHHITPTRQRAFHTAAFLRSNG